MLAGMDLAPELPRIACPVLVIAGTLDRTRPPLMVEPVARAISGARYVELDGAHLCNIEDADAFSHALGNFLNS